MFALTQSWLLGLSYREPTVLQHELCLYHAASDHLYQATGSLLVSCTEGF